MSAAPPSSVANEPMVETMTGPIRTADLGLVLMHEPIIVRSEGLAQFPPYLGASTSHRQGLGVTDGP